MRFISLFCAVLLPSLTFALVREIYATEKRLEKRGFAIAIPTAALVGFSPFLTYYFQEARMYILLLVLTLAAILALLRSTRLESWKEWCIYSLLLSLSFYTHYFALFLLPAFLLFACLKGQEYLKRWLGFTILALKGNQGNLYTEVQDLFKYAQEIDFRDVEHDFHQTVDKGHGRIEIRQCWTIAEPDFLALSS